MADILYRTHWYVEHYMVRGKSLCIDTICFRDTTIPLYLAGVGSLFLLVLYHHLIRERDIQSFIPRLNVSADLESDSLLLE